MNVLVTGATGMFGSSLVDALDRSGVDVLAMTRSKSSAQKLTRGNVTGVVGDLDDPSSLPALMERADRMFLVSPIHPELGRREIMAIEAAETSGIAQVVKLFGAVRHEGDPLDTQHQMSLDALASCSVPWTIVSPQTVMETNLLGQIEGIKHENSMYASAGDGRIGMVALCDCIEVAAIVLQADPTKWAGANLEITGPAALTYSEIADEMGRALGRPVSYVDMPEKEFAAMLIEYGFPDDEDLDLQVLCHFRQMRSNKANLVTNTFQELAGRPATSIYEWTLAHRELFANV
ncbi:MAG: NmrA family NAD(P)-binding protein [Phycisphaerae bacterium]|nr:NmrA family NAD(P)-binding protein [Phycisphaerae bacterium]MBT6269161.1 NmrA family NAD(P)-binding protein [Phycisphaerae bacterium]MBT6282624.1 NmrA family NAD(P)-binding protein [Phycisphaerae bacterium]